MVVKTCLLQRLSHGVGLCAVEDAKPDGTLFEHTVRQGELNLVRSHRRCSLSKGFGVKTAHGQLVVILERFISK